MKLLVLALSVLGAPACANSSLIYGLPPEQLEERALEGDFAFLEGVDEADLNARGYRQLEPGTGYYLGRMLLKYDRPDAAFSILRHEAEQGEEPWRRAAALLLVRELTEAERYVELAEAAAQLTEVYPDVVEIYRGYADALYRLERDTRLERFLSQVSARDDAVGSAFSGAGEVAAEAALWRAVVAYRNENPEWRSRFDFLYREFAPSDAHSRVYLYIIARPELYQRLEPKRRSLYEAKHHLNEQRYSDAWTAFSAALEEGAAELLSRRLIHDLGVAGERGGGWREASVRLEQLAEALPAELELTAMERLGRLYRVGGMQADALRVLREAHRREPENERILWYLLSASSFYDHDQFVRDLRAHAERMVSPGYYDDLFEAAASRMVADEAWEALWDVYTALQENGTARMRARYAFILAVASAERGFLPPNRPGRDAEVVKRELLATAANQNASPYYALVARVALGRDLELLSQEAHASRQAGAGADSAAVRTQSEVSDRRVLYQPSSYELDRLVTGYFRYGLYGEGYEAALRHAALMSSNSLITASVALGEERMQLEALRLLGRARGHPDFVLDREHAELLYPMPYRRELEEVAERERLDWSLFYALVREESHFAADVVSHAGAVGLSQLLPSTAADVAARMGLANPTLTDPAVNLSIGGYYLRGLLDRFPSVMHALAAYNGGQGRVRSWERLRPSLGQFLFHEAIPFYETREYVRKILVSAVYYAHLYEDRSAAEVITAIFPEFASLW